MDGWIILAGVIIVIIIWQIAMIPAKDLPRRRRVDRYNSQVKARNEIRDDYWARGGQGEPSSLPPLDPRPADESRAENLFLVLGIVAAIVFILWVISLMVKQGDAQ